LTILRRVSRRERFTTALETVTFAEPNDLLVFSGTTCSTVTGKRTIECTFTIDPSKSPKWIDVTRTEDKVACPGIYELKDGTLKVFLGTPGGKRPTEFKTKEGTQQVIHTHERVKP
jgi:uncharacterized protein (TIGR03067 family)